VKVCRKGVKKSENLFTFDVPFGGARAYDYSVLGSYRRGTMKKYGSIEGEMSVYILFV